MSIVLLVSPLNWKKNEAQNQRLLEIRKKSLAEQKKVLRDQRKAMLKEKKEKSEAEALLSAVKVCDASILKRSTLTIINHAQILNLSYILTQVSSWKIHQHKIHTKLLPELERRIFRILISWLGY